MSDSNYLAKTPNVNDNVALMADTLLVILPGTLPEGYCWPSNPDDFQRVILELARVKLPATSGGGVVISQNTPATTDWDKLWVRTDGSGNLIRNYTHGGYGVWVSPHPEPPASAKRLLWTGTENALKTFDEGVDEAVTAVTGPFWEVDHDFDGRFPIAPGTVDDDLDVAVGDQGGASTVVLTANQLAQHKHLSPARFRLANEDVTFTDFQGKVPFTDTTGQCDPDTDPHSDFNHAYTEFNDVPAAGTEGHPNLPPYRGVFVIKRTVRQFYSVS